MPLLTKVISPSTRATGFLSFRTMPTGAGRSPRAFATFVRLWRDYIYDLNAVGICEGERAGYHQDYEEGFHKTTSCRLIAFVKY